MTASDLLEIITAAILDSQTVLVDPPPGEFFRSVEFTPPEYQARAVLDALGEAGGVEWGVKWPFDALGARPLETVSRSAAEATAESLAKITPKGNPAPVVVSRIAGPWERAE